MAEKKTNPLHTVKKNYCLKRHTAWRVGGRAHLFYKPYDLNDLHQFLKQTPQDTPPTYIGLGSNLLVREGGVKGLVIATLNRLNTLEKAEQQVIYAQAGVTCAKLARLCAKNGFEEGAFFAGIPGTVGGSLAMNAGAFGYETWSYVISVETIDSKGCLRTRKPSDYAVTYRSVEGPRDEWFVGAHFHFPIGNPAKAFNNIQRWLKQRAETQPIGMLSCGSVFRNPPGDYAGRLIEAAGLKGYQHGGAVISDKHANFILNPGEATADDIEELVQLIIEKVKKEHNVTLIPEVKIIGEHTS